MINDLGFYIFVCLIVLTVIYLIIYVCFEKTIKSIEKEERAKKDDIPLLLMIRLAKRFSIKQPVFGAIYLYILYFMLGMVPTYFFLWILEMVIK